MAMEAESSELELRDYLTVLRRRRGMIVAVTVVVVLAAVGLSLLQTEIYRARAEVLVQPRVSERIFTPEVEDRTGLQTRVETEVEVMRSRSVSTAAAEELGQTPSVSVGAKGDTDVVEISVDSEDPAFAARAANVYAKTYIDTRRSQLVSDLLAASGEVQQKITDLQLELDDLEAPLRDLDAEIDATDPDDDDELERLEGERASLEQEINVQRQSLLAQLASYTQQLDQLQLSTNITQIGGAQLVSDAEVPTDPVRPTPRRNAVLGLIVGLMAGVGLAFSFEYLDDTIKTKDDLEEATGGQTVLGLVPTVGKGWKKGDEAKIVSVEAPESAVAEAYRAVRTSIQFMGLDRPLRLIQVTSAAASEGKTTTIANLAVALARADQRVVVVCCDLRRPRIHEFFGLSNEVGFTSVLLGEAQLADAVQRTPQQNRLFLLASGPPPPNPSELLSSRRVIQLFDALKQTFDVVLIDSPPVLPVTDALVLSGAVDGTVFVASANRASRKEVAHAIELLQQVEAPLIGAILNGVDTEHAYGYGYGYRYGYSYRARPNATNLDTVLRSNGESEPVKSAPRPGRSPFRRSRSH